MSFSPKLVSRQNVTRPSRHEKAFGFVREGIGYLNFLSPLSIMEIVFKIFSLFRAYEQNLVSTELCQRQDLLPCTYQPNHIKVFAHWVVLMHFI